MKFGYKKTELSLTEGLFGLGGIVILIVFLLLSIGLLFIFSAVHSKSTFYQKFAIKQFFWIIIALIPFIVVICFDYLWLIKNAYIFYMASIIMLIWTLLFGSAHMGARRWIDLGFFQLQTSEIMKIVLILTLAKLLTTQQKQGTFSDLVSPICITLLPMLLIVVQPDLGTSLVLVPICASMVFASGIKMKPLIILGIIAINLLIVAYFFGLKEYQKKRILMFIYQDNMTQEQKIGDGYHLNQSKITLGNGGLFGRGWKKGTQNVNHFLPENHTDFIFCTIGEEWGFLGAFVVVVLYFILFGAMIGIVYTTPIASAQLVVIGVISLLSFQMLINVCMAIGLAPITGLPLPFVSYGGSSLLFSFISIALVFSIAGRRIVS